jgi:hypothetical protein
MLLFESVYTLDNAAALTATPTTSHTPSAIITPTQAKTTRRRNPDATPAD